MHASHKAFFVTASPGTGPLCAGISLYAAAMNKAQTYDSKSSFAALVKNLLKQACLLLRILHDLNSGIDRIK